jgi:cobalamin-dependent methionine synthase I
MRTLLRGETTQVKVTSEGPAVVIGEKINPTGRKKLAAPLLLGRDTYAKRFVQYFRTHPPERR